MPILLVSFFSWNKHQDKEDATITEVKKINLKRDTLIFLSVLSISFITGIIFTYIGLISEGLSDYWYLDALANTFSVCNGLFLCLRYKEQWLPWYGVCICEAIMWILAGNWIMLILFIGYITNTTYGLIKWSKYANNHDTKEVIGNLEIKDYKEKTYDKLSQLNKYFKPKSHIEKESKKEREYNNI